MSSIERAKAVINRLRQSSDPAICPHCGYGDTKRFGAYPRTIRNRGVCAWSASNALSVIAVSAPTRRSVPTWRPISAMPAARSAKPWTCGCSWAHGRWSGQCSR